MSLMGNILPAHEVRLAVVLAPARLRAAAQVQSVERSPVMRAR
jgi:hypothetical protein